MDICRPLQKKKIRKNILKHVDVNVLNATDLYTLK